MSVPERYWHYIGPRVRARVAALAVVADEPGMQDWPLEVADAKRTEAFIALYEASTDEEERFALMELVLYSLDEMPEAGRALWSRVEELLVAAGALHASPVIYWGCLTEDPDGTWIIQNNLHEQFGITPLARKALARLREEIGFIEWR